MVQSILFQEATLSLILIIIAGAAKGLMDRIRFHWGEAPEWMREKSRYWNPDISWRNKYHNGIPSNGSKFPMSTTLLVSLTDGWHLLQMIFLTSMSLSIAVLSNYHWVLSYVVIRLVFGLFFTIFYK